MTNYLLDSTFESLIRQMIKKDVYFKHLDSTVLPYTIKDTESNAAGKAGEANPEAKGNHPQGEKPAVNDKSKKKTSKAETRTVVPIAYTQNCLLYDAWLHCYVGMIEDRCKNSYEIKQALFAKLGREGLVQFIKGSCEFWDNYCYHGIIGNDSYFKPLLEEVLTQEQDDLLPVQVAAEIFRYGKRLSPFGNEHLAVACEEAFWDCEKLNRVADKKEISWYWVKRVYDTMTEMLDSAGLLESNSLVDFNDDNSNHRSLAMDYDIHARNWVLENSHKLFTSPNSIQDLCRCRLCKSIALDIFLRNHNPYISESMQESFIEDLTKLRSDYWKSIKAYGAGREFQYSEQIVGIDYTEGHIVPKNWKSFRMVGSDQVKNYHWQSKIERRLRKMSDCVFKVEWLEKDRRKRPRVINLALGHQIPIDDQSLQRDRAFDGAIGKGVDTLDLSSASDLHRKTVVRSVFINDWANLLCEFVPKGMIINKKKCNLKMFAPMGSPLTFRVMQYVLYAIIVTVTIVVGDLLRWSPEELEEALAKAGVFGDDITCASEITETLIEVLHLFGFKVNMDKSCTESGQHLFREACGGDYYDGIDISTAYWPRKQIDFTKFSAKVPYSIDGFTLAKDDPVTTLIAHSKAIRKFSVTASQYLNSVILKKIPTMTTSVVGSTSPDLWARFPVAKPTVSSPHVRDVFRHKVYDNIELKSEDWEKGMTITKDKSPRRITKYEKKIINVDGKLTVTFTDVGETVDLKIAPLVKKSFSPEFPHDITRWDSGTSEEKTIVAEKKVFVDWQSDELKRIRVTDSTHDSISKRELTCTPIPIFNRKKLSDKCVVERLLIKKHNLDVDALLDYYKYVEETSNPWRYKDPLMELLRIPEAFDENSLFSQPMLEFKRK